MNLGIKNLASIVLATTVCFNVLTLGLGTGVSASPEMAVLYSSDTYDPWEDSHVPLWRITEDVSMISRDGKFGLINAQGAEIAPPVFDDITDYHNGFVSVGIGATLETMRWGAIEVSTGTIVLPLAFSFDEIIILRHFMSLSDCTAIPSNVERLHWNEVSRILPMRTPIQVFDIFSGITYYVSSLSNNIHADVETVTARDTELLFESFDGISTWFGQPIWVTIGDRTIAATIHSVPHDISTIANNNMDGHICMHFYGSFTSNVGVHTHNQDMVDFAYEIYRILADLGLTGQPECLRTLMESMINVKVNGVPLAMDALPAVNDGRTFMPLRSVGEALGAQFSWDGSAQEITMEYSGTTITMIIGSNSVTVRSSSGTDTLTLDVAPLVSGGRTTIPLRDIAQIFGYNVDWDNDTRTAFIVSGS